MSILTKINSVRRQIMRVMTRRLGRSRLDATAIQSSKANIRRVLICRPNHRLGNQLLITPLITEVIEALPHAQVDLFVKGSIAPFLFKQYEHVGHMILLPKKPVKNMLQYLRGWMTIITTRYDLVINAVHGSSSGRISAQLANARLRFLGEISNDVRSRVVDYQHMAKAPVYSFRSLMAQLGFEVAAGPVAPPDLKLTSSEIAEGRQILNGLVGNEERTISIYTFATGAKCYDKEWWTKCYEELKARFPDFNIIEILPIENVSQIGFTAPSFYSKDLRQIASLMANVDAFIGADSGMMHLASASGTNVVGLFKSDNMPVYTPYNRRSRGVRTDRVSSNDLMIAIESALGQVDEGKSRRRPTVHSG